MGGTAARNSEGTSVDFTAANAGRLQIPRSRLSVTVLLGVLAALAGFGYFSRFCDDSLFINDAADYVRGARIGFFATYFDTQSIGLWGSLKVAHEYPQAQAHFFDFLQHRGDAAPNRHFHVAPGMYGAVVASEFGAANRTYRLIAAAAGAVAIGVMFIGLRLAGVNIFISIATVVLAILSPAIVTTSSVVAPHAPFMAALLASGFVFAQYLERQDLKFGVAFGVAVGFAVALCELSMVVCAAYGAILALQALRSGIKSTLKLLLIPGISFLGTVTLLWPGGVIRGSYGLSYGSWILYILFRSRGDFHEHNPSVVLARGSQGTPLFLLVFVLIVIGALILALTRNSNTHIYVFSWLVLGFFTQGMLNQFKNPTYVAHFTAVTWVLLALVADRCVTVAKERSSYALVVPVWAVYMFTAILAWQWPFASARAAEQEELRAARAQEVMVLANRIIPSGATILGNVDYEIWGLYLPQYVVEHSVYPSDLQPRSWVKVAEDHWIIADPQVLSVDWRERLRHLASSDAVGGYVIAHVDGSGD